MLRFKSYLEEKRRNPKLNPKISVVELLRPYKDDPDMYISFTTIDKIGINPKSQYDTPNGIYTYPLKEIFDEVDSNNIAFAGDAPYVWLLKSKNKKRFVKDLYKDYTSKDYDKDMKKIKKLWGDKSDDIDEVIHDGLETRQIKSPVGAFWQTTKLLTNLLYHYDKIIKARNEGSAWNSILRKLGYSGFADKSSKGIIHPSEPIQAVFLSKDAFTVIDKFENKRYEGRREVIWKSTVFQGQGADWVGGGFKDSTWYKGTWHNGTFKNGTWITGLWKKGTWISGTWYKGTWENGIWESGTWMDGTWLKGTWKDGVWKKGTWKGGTWLGGYDKDGNFHEKGDSPDKW